MSQSRLRQHTSNEHFTLGDLEDLIVKARKDLGRDCVLWFPMDTRIYSDEHGVADALTITADPGEINNDGVQEAFIDIDFS